MSFPELEVLNNYVSRVFRVEDVTSGDPQMWIVRYRGHLLSDDTDALYDQLAEAVKSYGLTPLFRKEGGAQVIYLAPTPVIPKPSTRIYINVILFVLTIFSMLFVWIDIPPDVLPANGPLPITLILRYFFSGWPFALSMMGILFAHEMGHYIACRIYKVPATLPFFIPVPIPPLGTLGVLLHTIL